MKKELILPGIAGALALAALALADGRGGDHRGMPGAAASGVGHASASSAVAASAAAAGTAAPSSKIDDEGGSDDEKPEQREKRHGYVAKQTNHLRDLVRANGKRVTDEERTAIREHWRRAMRLWRIRHLALLDGDKAVVARVDAILARLDKQTENTLKDLNAKAPADGAPAASASVPIGGVPSTGPGAR